MKTSFDKQNKRDKYIYLFGACLMAVVFPLASIKAVLYSFLSSPVEFILYEAISVAALFFCVKDFMLVFKKEPTESSTDLPAFIYDIEHKNLKQLPYTVLPSEEKSISVEDDPIYGGAHRYILKNSLGFNNGKAEYDKTETVIQFVQKNDDGTMIPGVQSEQLALILLDRTEKLNKRFPSRENQAMMDGLRVFLDACEDRVKNRMERGVMGDLKK